MKDPKAIRKAIMTAKSIAAMVDPHFARVPLPEIGEPNPEEMMPPQQFAAGGVTAGRSPELQSYAQNIGTPDFDQEQYHSLIDQHKPVRPYESIPVPATEEDMLRGLTTNKHHKINAVNDYQEGHPVGLRLDIPAYTKHGVWVPTMHDLLQGGKSFSHQGAAHITDATFDMPESQASAVAKGRAKSPFAHIDGRLKKTPVDDIHEMAKAALDSPEWVQVGMDPERHSYFYDRANHRKPIHRADEVLQVGPLVLAKNPVFGDSRDHAYEDGGRVGYADGGSDDDQGRSPIIMVHGGSDFEDIDPSRYGSGEPGGIRPLGNGLYGFVLHSGNMDEAPRAVDFARHYATKYGRGKKAIHAFRIDLDGTDTGFNGPEIENLRGQGGAERQRVEEAYEQREAFPSGSTEWWDATDRVRAAERALQKSQAARFERLPVGLTEGAVHAPHRLKRIGKIDLDQPDEHLLDIIHKEMGTKRASGGRTGYADGGSDDDDGGVDRQANLSAFLEGNHPLVPDVVYHGTDRDISQFDTEQPRRVDVGIDGNHTDTGWYGKGHYLTPYKQAASHFATGYRMEGEHGPNVMPVHLSLKNPFIVKVPRSSSGAAEMDRAMDEAGFPQTSDERLLNKKRGERLPSEQTRMLMERGHDGVVVLHQYGIKDRDEEKAAEAREQEARERHQAAKNAFYEMPYEDAENADLIKPIKDEFLKTRREFHAAKEAAGGEYKPHELVVFKPHQIKSAIGNNGRYDPNEPEINKAAGGRTGYALGGSDDSAPDYASPDTLGLYSHAAATAASLPQAKASPDEFRNMLTNRGVKPAEFQWSGYDDAFADQPQVTREQVAAHFHENKPPVGEKVFQEGPLKEDMEALEKEHNRRWNDHRRQMHEAQAEGRDFDPNSEQYIQLSRDRASDREALKDKYQKPYHENYMLPGGENYREVLLKHDGSDSNFAGNQSHFRGEPDILAHLLMKDRTDTEGKKVLHLDELQSDWAQQGRKEGFKGNSESEKKIKSAKKAIQDFHDKLSGMESDRILGIAGDIPDENKDTVRKTISDLMGRHAEFYAQQHGVIDEHDRLHDDLEKARNAYYQEHAGVTKTNPAPYVTNTNDWVDLGLKRALLEAAKGGHDKLALTPGYKAAERYDLSKHIAKIEYLRKPDGDDGYLLAHGHHRANLISKFVDDKDLPGIIGKDVAEKLLAATPTQNEGDDLQRHTLEGLDLRVGGEGMKKFYDEIVPKRLMRLAKMHDPDAQFSTSTVEHPKDFSEDEQPNDDRTDLRALEITPRMRESILKKGFPAYAQGGEVEGYAGGGGADPAKIKKALERIYNPLSTNPEHVKRALEIAQSYSTPVGGETGVGSFYRIKQSLPVSGVKSTVGNIPGVNLKPVKKGSWEDFYNRAKGGLMVNVGGDLSNFGRLTHINGKKLAWPVDLHAGADYMREPNPGRVWANIQGHATGFSNKIRAAEEAGKEVFGVLSPMGPVAVDSSHNMFDALMAQIPNANIDPKDMDAFDDAIKRGEHLEAKHRNNPKIMESLQQWPGIASAKETSDFARPSSKKISGENRSLIVKFMGLDKWQKRGFPEVGMTRVAITNPDLVGIGGNKLGYRIAKLSSKPVLKTGRVFEHSTYPVDTFGEYLQDVPLVERHDATPDVTDQIITTPYKGDIIAHPYSADDRGRGTYRQLFEQQKQMQPVNQRMLDSIMSADERKQQLGFKKGGTVRSALMIAKGLKKK